MKPTILEQDINVYATEAFTIQKPAGDNYTVGVEVGKTIPAKWWNWLFNAATSRLRQARSDFTAIHKELTNTITEAGIVPSSEDNTQLLKAVETVADERINDYIQDNVINRFKAKQVIHETISCPGIQGDTFGVTDILSIGITEHIVCAVIYKTGYIYIVVSTDIKNWQVVHTITDTLLEDTNVFIAAGVVATPTQTAVSVYFQNTTETSGGGLSYSSKEFLLQSEDSLHWNAVLSLSKNDAGVCLPALLYVPEYNRLYFLSSINEKLYHAVGTFSAVSAIADLADLRQLQDLNQNTSRGARYDVAIKPIYATIGNNTGYLAGNLLLLNSIPGIQVLDRTAALGRAHTYQLHDGNYVCVERSLYRSDIIDTSFIINADDGSITAVAGAFYETGLTTVMNDVVHYEAQVEGYMLKFNFVSGLTGTAQFSEDGITYAQVPFTTAYEGIVYDKGTYYVAALEPADLPSYRNIVIYSIKGHLSADTSDYTFVSKLRTSNYSNLKLKYIGIHGAWFRNGSVVYNNYGRSVVSGNINYLFDLRMGAVTIPYGKDYFIFDTNGVHRVLGSAAKVSGNTLYTRSIV